MQNHRTEAETEVKWLRTILCSQAGCPASSVWPSDPVSMSKEKGGIGVFSIRYTKATITVIVITPQFALNDAQSRSALLVMRSLLRCQLMPNRLSASLRDGREPANGLVPRVSSRRLSLYRPDQFYLNCLLSLSSGEEAGMLKITL